MDIGNFGVGRYFKGFGGRFRRIALLIRNVHIANSFAIAQGWGAKIGAALQTTTKSVSLAVNAIRTIQPKDRS
ncbi:MAG TPA: hypothetical protein VGO72_06480, partial [Herminiimonas sp.]|nr:hypothetical protein [Herminiimonas sp.]